MLCAEDIPALNREHLRWGNSESDVLGKGSFGIVYRGTLHNTPVAIKVAHSARSDPASHATRTSAESAALRQHRREVHRLSVVRNPYVIQYLGVFRDTRSHDLYIVTECLDGGSLHAALSAVRARNAVLDERSFLQIAMHMAYGLTYIHAQQYTHGDMKPQNVLLTTHLVFKVADDGRSVAVLPESAKVKIADFGLSKRLEGAESAGFREATAATGDFGTGPCGTYLYMAPEAYRGVSTLSDADAKAADVYAYGLILFELLSGLVSWGLEHVRSAMRLHILVEEGKRPAWGPRERDIRPEYVDLVTRCWSQETKDRPTAEEIVEILRRLADPQGGDDAATEAALPLSPPPLPSPAVVETDESVGEAPLLSRGSPRRPRAGYKVPPAPPERSYSETESDEEDYRARVEDSEDEGLASGGTIVQVESMRMLTSSQKEEYLRDIRAGNNENDDEPLCNGSAAEDVRQERDERQFEGDPTWEREDSEVHKDESVVEEPEGLILPGVAEIDQSRVGGVMVRRVQSVQIPVPEIEPLQIISEHYSRPTMGMGSVAGQLDLRQPSNARSANEIVGSFLRAEVVGDPAGEKQAHFLPEDGPSPMQGGNADEAGSGRTPMTLPGISPEVGLSPVHAEPSHGMFLGSNPNAMPGMDVRYDASRMGAEGRGRFRLPHAETRRSYSSPSDVDEASLSELNAEDTRSWPSYSHVMTSSNHSGVHHSLLQTGQAPPFPYFPSSGAPAPTPPANVPSPYGRTHLGDSRILAPSGPHMPSPHLRGSQVHTGFSNPGNLAHGPSNYSSVSPMHPGMVSPSSMHPATRPVTHARWGQPALACSRAEPSSMQSCGSVNSQTEQLDISTVHLALERPDAMMHLRSLWGRGHLRTVAAGLSSARNLKGKNSLQVTREFLQRHNQETPERQNVTVLRDLAVALGNIARIGCSAIGAEAVEASLRQILITMQSHSKNFSQNYPGTVQLYSSCNFALCNLFKVNNGIRDPGLRTQLAAWIAHSISWNVFEDGESAGPRDDALSYTATSAARNFMWMNEDNVAAFTTITPGGREPATNRLISSMKFFDYTGSFPVLEASLSALATIVHFPQHRLEFMKRQGARSVLEMVSHHAGETKVVGLIFSMITVLFSGCTGSADETEALYSAFVENNGCKSLVSAVELVQQHVHCDDESLDVLDKGCAALLTTTRFSSALRSGMVESGCAGVALKLIQWLASGRGSPSRTRDMGTTEASRVKLGATLCELVQVVSKDSTAAAYLRERGIIVALNTALKLHGCDSAFGVTCRLALASIL